jgi:hypothetical protein
MDIVSSFPVIRGAGVDVGMHLRRLPKGGLELCVVIVAYVYCVCALTTHAWLHQAAATAAHVVAFCSRRLLSQQQVLRSMAFVDDHYFKTLAGHAGDHMQSAMLFWPAATCLELAWCIPQSLSQASCVCCKKRVPGSKCCCLMLSGDGLTVGLVCRTEGVSGWPLVCVMSLCIHGDKH